MKRVSWKNLIIFFIVGALGITIVAIRIKYFSSQPHTEKNNEKWKGLGDVIQNVSSETKSTYNKIAENISNLKDALTQNSGFKKVILDKETKKFQEEMMKKIEEKNIEKLDPYIKGMRAIFPKEWTFSLTTVEKGVDGIPVATMLIKSTSTCAIKTFEWYDKNRSGVLKDIISRYNQDSLPGMCQKKLLYTTNTYVVIDSCSNDVTGCDDEKVMQEKLDIYFK